MINGKKLYAYNKDTARREELQIEASSVTFKNSTNFEKFTGSTDEEDGFGGGFFPTPLKTDRGTYLDSDGITRSVPYFLSSDGTWRYAVTDTSMYLRKDEAENDYVKKTDTIANATHAVTADTATTAVSAGRLTNSVNISINLDSTVTSAVFDGSTSISFGVIGSMPESRGGTGAASLAEVTVGNATKAQKDGEGNVISSTYQRKPIKGNFTVAASQWISDANETESEFVFYYDIPATGVTDSWMPTVVVDKKSQNVAIEAGFLGAAESRANSIRVRCKERPGNNISGSYYAFDV